MTNGGGKPHTDKTKATEGKPQEEKAQQQGDGVAEERSSATQESQWPAENK